MFPYVSELTVSARYKCIYQQKYHKLSQLILVRYHEERKKRNKKLLTENTQHPKLHNVPSV